MSNFLRLWTFLLFFLSFNDAFASSRSPQAQGATFEKNIFFRLLGSIPESNFTVLVEYQNLTQSVGASSNLSTKMTGLYFQPVDALRFGLFYKKLNHYLYDEDWVRTSQWSWQNNDNRSENQWVFDFSPRFIFWYPDHSDGVFELKTRFITSDYASQKTLQVKPNIIRPILKDGKPWVTMNAALEFYFPLNYAKRTLYEWWAYVGATYRVASIVDLGFQMALQRRYWDSPAAFEQATGENYSLTHTSVVGSLGIILRLE